MTDTDGVNITNALNSLLPTFCSDWNVKPMTVTYVPKGKFTTIPLKCFIMDSTDVKDALGYHDSQDDLPYAKVFLNTILEYNGAILYSENPRFPTLALTVSHEVFEMIIDIRANTWWNSADGSTFYAAEVCDPVGSNVVKVQLKGAPMVGLSDWILPTWADSQATKGPYNNLNTLKAPLTVDKGGYIISISKGKINMVMGSDISPYTKEMMHTCSLERGKQKLSAGPITSTSIGYI